MAVVDGTNDADPPSGLSKPALLNTGVTGWVTPATTPDMTPTDAPATVVPAITALVEGPATIPGANPAAALSFGLAFFFEPPPDAAAMAALLGRITCPSGPSFA
jgi:hypothetical protein